VAVGSQFCGASGDQAAAVRARRTHENRDGGKKKVEGDPKILCFLEISLREEIAKIAVIATPVAKIAKIENLGYREQVTEDRKSKTYHRRHGGGIFATRTLAEQIPPLLAH